MAVDFFPLGLILLLPAVGVVFNLFLGAKVGRSAVNVVGPGVVFAAFAIALTAFIKLLSLPEGSSLNFTLWPWIQAGKFSVDVSIRIDALSGVMVLIVSGVGALIHLYSCGYMGHDDDYARFFTYMNLFMLSMLLLVLADNLLLMFVGWEGVGLCSYLLISFWYTNPEYAYNGRKAFVVNRIGDAGFILGLLTLFAALSSHGIWTLKFAEMRAHMDVVAPAVATAAGLLLLLGATGKSAQLPLYVWLPDAMVGPTPVSALIHAATMVTAGVYMVARMSFLYRLTPTAMDAVATIGALTALFAATIALVQADIKRVLAYSTISQLGYMFLGVGVGAFSAGIFHVMTHAFFKALLFLGAGSVIHALGGEQDMNKMGALRDKLPITYATMLIATLAITAIPGFSGFFSKDAILGAAFTSGHTGLWLIGVITAGLTGFYMFRWFFMTFHGNSRVEHERLHHLHESPPVMTIPLMVLAVLALVGGWVGLPEGMLWGNAFGRFLVPSVGEFKPVIEFSELALTVISVVVSFAGIAFAYVMYIRRLGLPEELAARSNSLYQLFLNKWYVDQLYNLIVTRPLFFISRYILWRGVDSYGIEGLVNGAGLTVETGSGLARRSESGNVQHYAFVYLVGAIGIAAYYIYRLWH
ncbi:MAG: NADH-quinone oxidoreductase subunit L [Candidatus Binataceae bacterium]|jgi:NADH-quinone oxidoreductase subunit L